jgi:Phospholipase B
MRISCAVLLSLCCLWPVSAVAGDFQPDPASVQRFGQGYRYPQAGWIVLHIEGEPYERGVQHGRLLAPEIAANIRCFAASQCSKSPSEGWKLTRLLVNALFLRRFDREYLEEMKGIADGAAAAGAKIDGRPVDLVDIVALNTWEEVLTLDNAHDALPTGLEGARFPKQIALQESKPKPSRCSAFAATGSATTDGKIVFGHITMSDLYSANYSNVWLDVKPAKGRRVLMQSIPGSIQSGVDYYINDAGLLVCETTIAQTRFEIKGLALASRIRKALQYSDTIDQAVEILKEQNNGLYTNEWLLADIKTNEIAMFELGTYKTKLWRSSKNEWFGGTEGFYWGCNNTKDLGVRLESIPGIEAKPAAMVFHPSDRDKEWLKLYDRHKGKIDADFGRLAFTTPPLAAYHSADAKYTTSAMAKELKTWALCGAPLGRTWEPTKDQIEKYPEIRPLVSNPWVVLHGGAPAPAAPDAVAAVDLRNQPSHTEWNIKHSDDDDDDESPSPTTPAWHGTVLPKTDADIWLAVGFAKYERIVALEKSLQKGAEGKMSESAKEQVSLALFACRADYELGSRAGGDVPLSMIRSDVRRDEWFRIASGKGVLLLSALREKIGAANFDEMMDGFGRANAGKEVTTAAFRAAAEKTAGGHQLAEFFDAWLNRPGLADAVAQRSGPFAVTTFYAELDQSLIVYGTLDESPTNREAAEALQQAIRARHANFTVPIKADRDVTAEDLKKNHVLLIGRPDSNRLLERIRDMLPIKFGSQSFHVRGETYAHCGSAVMAAAANPDNPRFSVVVIAGLDAASTLKAAPRLPPMPAAEVVVLPHGEAGKLFAGPGSASKHVH